MGKECHVKQNVDDIRQRHQDGQRRCPREKHQTASNGFEKANPEDQITSLLQCDHESSHVIGRVTDGIAIDGKAHRHDSRSKQE